jgi:gas vesicle protein
MKASTFFIGLAAGAVAAAVTVLYSTPQSGSQLRTSVRDASSDMKFLFKDVKVKVDDLKESISHLTKEAKETVPSTIDGIKGSVDQWQQSTDSNRARMEKEIAAIQTALEELEQTIAKQQK